MQPPGIARCTEDGRAGQGSRPDARLRWHLAATRRGAGRRHRSIRSRRAWPSLIDKLRTWIRAEAGAGRLLPWVPVAFGTGIALYFTADREPVLSVVAVVAVGLCAAAFLLRRQKIFPIAVM